MEERKDILDEAEIEQPEAPDHQRRSFRFLLYALGIGLVITVRFWSCLQAHPIWSCGDNFLLMSTIGLMGIWLFSGLGLLAIIRMLRVGRVDLVQLALFALHLALLVWSSTRLVGAFWE